MGLEMKQNNGTLLAELIFVIFAFKMDGFESGVSIMRIETDHMLILHGEDKELDNNYRKTFMPESQLKQVMSAHIGCKNSVLNNA
jgi:hypothetical protein